MATELKITELEYFDYKTVSPNGQVSGLKQFAGRKILVAIEKEGGSAE